MEKKIIFELRNGISIEKTDGIFSGFSTVPKRLHDIGDKLELFFKVRNEEFLDLSEKEANELFDLAILPFLSDLEQDLYRTYFAVLEEDEAAIASRILVQQELVTYVQDTRYYSIQYSAKPTAIKINSGLQRIRCDDAWINSRGSEIVVSVIDSGIDYKHDYFKYRLWEDGNGYFGRDFITDTSKPLCDPIDRYGHGTHCAGIIAANNDDIIEVAVAPKAKLMALKVFNKPEDPVPATTDTAPCVQAIKFAADNKANVISNSWTPLKTGIDEPLKKVIDYAYSLGCILVFAAGNDEDDIENNFPANYEKVISVAATSDSDELLCDSNYGKKITICAPGDMITSLLYDSITGTTGKSGTSMACPHVAGVIALLLAVKKDLTLCLIKEIICATGVYIFSQRPLGKNKRISAAESVAMTLKIR